MKRFFVLLFFIVCFMIPFSFASEVEEEIIQETPNYQFETLKGEVIEAGNPYEKDNELYQDLKIYINDGKIRTTVQTTASLTYYIDTTNYSKPYGVGDKIFVYTTFEDGKMIKAEVAYRNTTNYIVILLILFVLVVVLVGGFKGFKSIMSLLITILLIFGVLIPGIIHGKNPLLLTILISIATIIVTFLMIGGFRKKSFAAMIGTSGGIIVAGILAIVFGDLFVLSGMCEETGMITVLSDVAKGFDFRGILFSGIIIGALGASMDVGMSIASALSELKEENPEINCKRLIKAGMNIGRDMIGTMTNTLILAYTGGAILTILLQVLGGLDLQKIVNQEIISEELLRSIAGSIGLILTIPLTALASGVLMGNKQIKRGERNGR